ncbi:MAG: STAS domain-containing protein [Deltaproteobacteria bacterium]|nr:STAS domain-containing protein [Deltaproteobacteria bacterium]
MIKTPPAGKDCTLTVVQGEGEVRLTVTGRLCVHNLAAVQAELRGILPRLGAGKLIVDLAGVTYLDSAGALGLARFKEEAGRRDLAWSYAGVSSETQKILDLIDLQALAAPPLKGAQKPGFVETVGEGTLDFLRDLSKVVVFVGDLVFALVYSLFHPRKVRWDEVLFYMRRAGVDAFPILGLMSLLLGLVIAFMSSLQLKQLGAVAYVPPLVGVAMVYELGPLLTAILVAGRSGSAFAAEIGTMVVNEEVDAIIVMGFDPMKFLAVPKVLAAMLVIPFLTVYATILGIVGGLIIGVVLLDLTVYTYIQDTRTSLALFDVVSSLIKSVFFAAIVAGIGCQRGFMVRGGAEDVGAKTTSAVVAGLFIIIIVDAMFAVALHYIR